MWHRRRRSRLGVKTKHRKALVRNLVRGLVLHRQIETTYIRAKETSRFADQMVTLAKEGTLSARRQLIRHLASSELAKRFIEGIAPRLQDRNGGYTRVLKTGTRPGDRAQKALVEFSVPIELVGKKKAGKKAKPQAKPRPTKKESEAAEKEKKTEKEETQKRGGFLSKLRKFLTGDETK